LPIRRQYLGIRAAGRNAGRVYHVGQDRNRKMTTFDKREEGFERKFAIDEELKFKAVARRNKLLGQLIAEKLGKSGDEAAAYAKEVVAAVFEGDGDVLHKVLGDIKARGVDMTEDQLRARMDELMALAIAQVTAGI
jgi:hypothetical protein